jgi:hypothetical protein
MFNIRRKDLQIDKAKIEIKEIMRYCLIGLNDKDRNIIDPCSMGFDEEAFIDARLKHVETKYKKEFIMLGFNLEELKQQHELRKNKGRCL